MEIEHDSLVGLLTPSEAAILLKVSTNTVKKWLRSGKLRGSKLGGNVSGEWRTTERNCLDLYEKGKNY